MSTPATIAYLKKVKAETAHDKAKVALAKAEARLAKAAEDLQAAMVAVRPNTAEDYRIVIERDDGWAWASDEGMLDDVLGDAYSAEDAAPWLEAYNDGGGIYCWCVTLQLRNRVTGEFEWVDSCGGFFSYTDEATEDELTAALGTPEFEGGGTIEVVYR